MKYSVELYHPFHIEVNPWGSGLLLISSYGGCNENARVCSASNVNLPEKQDVKRVVDERRGKYMTIIKAAIELHHELVVVGFADEAGHMMTHVQMLLIEDIAKRAEQYWSDRVVGS